MIALPKLIFSKEKHAEGWLVDDIEPEHPLPPDRQGSQEEKAVASLRCFGIAILRNALNKSLMEEVAQSANSYVELIQDHLDNNRDFDDLDSSYNFYEKTYAADLVAIDPLTRSESNQLQLEKTRVFEAVISGPLRSLLERVVSIHASWSMGRVRIVFPDRPQDHSGALNFHQEKTVTPFAGLHNIWTPLLPNGIVTNVDTPGVQFFIGDRAQLINQRADEKIEQQNQELLGELSKIGEGEMLPDKEGFVLRPHVSSGDVIIFDRYVPHASYIPPSAKYPRVSLDIRLFPTPIERGPKPFPLDVHFRSA